VRLIGPVLLQSPALYLYLAPQCCALALARWPPTLFLCYSFVFILGGVFMTVPEELLAILVCPICKTPVQPLPDNSGLKCSTCKRIYPVRDDIPVMLPEEATVASE
jgi:hypothetical protein